MEFWVINKQQQEHEFHGKNCDFIGSYGNITNLIFFKSNMMKLPNNIINESHVLLLF